MEGLWIVLGSLLSTISGVIFWFLNSKTSDNVQTRAQEHEARMQEQRIASERHGQRDEAIRAMRRERLQPVFDVLQQVDNWLTFQGWRHVIESAESTKMEREVLQKLFPSGLPREAISAIADVRLEIRQLVPPPSPDLPFRAITAAVRVDDEQLSADLLLLGAALANPSDQIGWVSANLPKIHTRLEWYAAAAESAEQQSPPEANGSH